MLRTKVLRCSHDHALSQKLVQLAFSSRTIESAGAETSAGGGFSVSAPAVAGVAPTSVEVAGAAEVPGAAVAAGSEALASPGIASPGIGNGLWSESLDD